VATVTERIRLEVAGANRHFYIEDLGLEEPPDELDFSDPARWLLTMKNRLLLLTAAHFYHFADLIVEAWDGVPDDVSEQWEEQQEAQVELTEGVVEVWELAAGQRSGEPLALVGAGATWVRAYRSGGHDVVTAPTGPDGLVHGVERFLIQLWPDDQLSPSDAA
jgi:hypothetical protein